MAGVAPPLLRDVTRFHDQQEKREELCGAKGDERLRAGTVPTLPLLIFSSARCNHKLLALILVYFAKSSADERTLHVVPARDAALAAARDAQERHDREGERAAGGTLPSRGSQRRDRSQLKGQMNVKGGHRSRPTVRRWRWRGGSEC